MSEDIKITGKTFEKFPDVVKALSAVKKAYALTNARFGLLEKEKAEKVAALCDAVIANPPKELFTEIWQSDLTMLNARFNQYAQKETGVSVSELNLFQSTPDISQTVESIVIYKRLGEALDGIAYMQKALAQKAIEFKDEIRLMRTHLQESAVSTWGQTFGGFSLAIGRACRRIACDREAFRFVTAGATLFGVSIQDESEYSKTLLKTLSEIVGIELKRPGCGYEPVEKSTLLDELTGSEKLMNLTSDLKALAMINGKIGRVFVIYGSGPRAGIAEIMLPAIAPGSTIMPGKINPSMCHLVWQMSEFVTANDLALMMDVPVNKIIATCMNIGVMVSINQRLDAETINIVAEEFGFKTEYVSAEVSEAIAEEEDDEESLQQRPPIVTVMGHVDHGKTSLLDYIRNANVIAGEAGGITQHIGAYNVKLDDGRRITFLDTPGHEAFTAMRARGAKMTDIAIIIVAADDNVMPQTVEAINHASAAGVPIVFAINKIDKPNANPDKIKEELANMNYLVEDWGGKYQSQEISAKKGTGVAELMEKVLLEAELLDLKANPDRKAVGTVIESSLDKGRGYVATVLVQNGTLNVGDIMVAGTSYGKIRAMFNERNQRVTTAGPSAPVLVLGLNGATTAGDTFNILDSDREAREIANRREQLQRELKERTRRMPGLDDIARRRALGEFHELNLIVKGDVDGSIEALSDSLIKLSTPEVQVNVIHKAVGAISESDVTLASASDAVIIGFQVRPSVAAKRLAENDGVDIRLYSIIYDAIEEVKDAMAGMLSPEIKEEVTGTAEVLQTYKISRVGTIAGCMVREGKIKRTSKVRLIRDGIVIYTGDLGSLKRFKDDVKEVASGYDCGLNINNYNDVKEGDMIEAFEEIEVSKKL